VEALLRTADAALYEAKREGKGRVRVAQGDRARERPQRAAS
jgi:PleD family two-component response regulator